jgi:hypothetical protein
MFNHAVCEEVAVNPLRRRSGVAANIILGYAILGAAYLSILTHCSRQPNLKSSEEGMRLNFAIGTLVAAFAFAGSAQLAAQDAIPADSKPVLIPDGETVYDTVNHVTWLADANLAGKTLSDGTNFRFGLPLCDPLVVQLPGPCVSASGSMSYASAVAWVAAMNAEVGGNGYLGHSDWQLPATPQRESGCSALGPNTNNFGFGCAENALGSLYYTALGLEAPDTAVPIPPNKVGPFSNFQPNVYWSGSPGGGHTCSDPIASFNFGSGAQGGGCGGDFAYVLPMIKGELRGVPLPVGSDKLHVNLGGKTIYDPETVVTWLADANLAANWLANTIPPMDTLGLPLCTTAPDKTACVAKDGSMNYESAKRFIANMNAYNNGKGYLDQTNWELPSLDFGCPTYGCVGDRNPMGNLYYDQLKIPADTPVVAFPDIAVGPFHDLVPLPYWECLAKTIQDACEADQSAEFGFSFGTGFLGTARVADNHFVTAYYVGCDLSPCQTITFLRITAKDALTSLALSATASSGLAVSFTSTTPTVCTVSGDTASLPIPGPCTIKASQPGDDSFYSALPIQRTFTVNRAIQTITFPPIKTQKVGAYVNPRATASSGLKVTYSAGGSSQVHSLSTIPPPVCEVINNTVVTVTVGTCFVGAYQAGDDLYAPASAARSFKVTAQ